MAGMPQDWAAAVALAVVDFARRYHMRLGYVAFSTQADAPVPFGREYGLLARAIIASEAAGTTNYQAAMQVAMNMFEKDAGGSAVGLMARGRQSANRHILLVTDGATNIASI